MQRRQWLGHGSMGLASLALQSLLQRSALGAEHLPALPDGKPHFQPRAKSVIWLFMRGGVSHMESFDPKPELNRYAGMDIGQTPYKAVLDPERRKKVRVVVVNDANGQQRNRIYPLQVGYAKGGQSGIEISDWFPHLRRSVDDLAIVRSMWTTDDNHGAQVQFHSGRHMLDGRHPSIGAWVTYGLGSLNDNLPQFINFGPRFFDLKDGHYLGPTCDAVKLTVDPANPLAFAKPELAMADEEQRKRFSLAHRLNALSALRYPEDAALQARIKSYELAFHMQRQIPEIMSLRGESAQTQRLYGLDHAITKPFGQQLMVARRLVERGVRFIQIMHGDGAAGAWDSHSGLKRNHANLAAQVDKPIAGLLADLKQRGLLQETIVVFATEFGRTPGSQGSDGRDHHPYGFSVWMAGGGIRGGVVHGATDELGFHAVEHPHYVTDIHATLLRQLGLDSHRLEYPGRKRLEIDFGEVIREIV
jgi:hypothetical protein